MKLSLPFFNDHKLAWKIARHVVAIALGLAVFAGIGRYVGTYIPPVEKWIQAHPVSGPAVFILLLICSSMFGVPQPLFGLGAGAMFGIFWGTVIMTVGGVMASSIAFYLSGRFFRKRIDKIIAKHPRFAAVRATARQKSVRLQLLLRLTPMNANLLSSILSVSGVDYRTFLLGCIGMVPNFFYMTYIGYAAKHIAKLAGGVAQHYLLHDVAVFSTLTVCIVVMAGVIHMAHKAIQQYEAPASRSTSRPEDSST
ncbi:MAG: TVP38/TMEM64 family protein [Deltaproteobacteria bacterium]|nr:TVP38/TMEM64 family protein [Deltaproteobacteria bacterium]MBW2072070.1 TVP38/TMEM64 family protein [Deltaproteobacteria bacterium]